MRCTVCQAVLPLSKEYTSTAFLTKMRYIRHIITRHTSHCDGFSLQLGTGGSQKSPIACAPGHFCPAGTATDTESPCAAGTWTNLTNLREQAECYQCPRGYYCLEGSAAPTGKNY